MDAAVWMCVSTAPRYAYAALAAPTAIIRSQELGGLSWWVEYGGNPMPWLPA
jgi:hypothetical protein